MHRLLLLRFLTLLVPLSVLSSISIAQERRAPNTGAQIHRNGIQIPLMYSPPLAPWPAVQASIDGRPPLLFMLDTGQDAAVILDEWAATEMNLPITKEKGRVNGKETTIVTVNSIVVEGHDATGTKLPINFQLAHNKAHVLEQPQLKGGYATSAYKGARFAGILGIPLLEPVKFRLDFSRQTLTVFSRNQRLPFAPGTVTLPIEKCGLLYCINARVPGGKVMDLLIDTGAPSTTLQEMPLKNLKILGTQKGVIIGIEGTSRITDRFLLPSIELGGFLVIQKVLVGIEPKGETVTLGLDVLSRFRVTVEPANKLISFEPLLESNQMIRLPGKSGLKLVHEDGRFFVREVIPQSQAEKAGVRIDDRVVTIDDLRLDGTMKDVAQDLLDGVEGTSARLLLERSDAQMMIDFRRQHMLSRTIFASTGLILRNLFTVESMAVGSPAGRSGLRRNDVIFQINDIDIIKINDELKKNSENESQIAAKLAEDLLENLSRKSVWLKVWRKTTDEIVEFRLGPSNKNRPASDRRRRLKKTLRRQSGLPDNRKGQTFPTIRVFLSTSAPQAWEAPLCCRNLSKNNWKMGPRW